MPVVTASYSGFVNGDTATSLTTKPACSTTAKSSSPVGSYATSCSGAVDANYNITYVAGMGSYPPGQPHDHRVVCDRDLRKHRTDDHGDILGLRER